MSNPTCSRCGMELTKLEGKDNIFGTLGGHSPDQCIAALSHALSVAKGYAKSKEDEVTRHVEILRETRVALQGTRDTHKGYLEQLQENRAVVERIAKEFGLSAVLGSAELEQHIILGIYSLRLGLPHVDNPGQTHYDGCWETRGHHNCAVRVISALREHILEVNGRVEQIRGMIGLKDDEYSLRGPPGRIKLSAQVPRANDLRPGNEGFKVERVVNKPEDSAEEHARKGIEAVHDVLAPTHQHLVEEDPQ